MSVYEIHCDECFCLVIDSKYALSALFEPNLNDLLCDFKMCVLFVVVLQVDQEELAGLLMERA